MEIRLLRCHSPLHEHGTPAPTQIELPLILTNYACLYVFKENLIYFIIGELIAGFYSAVILIGNHERETRFK